MAGIFISYRRDDTAGYAGRLYERLVRRFGREHVFMDIDDVPSGEDFVRVLDDRLTSCNVLIAVIGNNWLKVTDSGGRRRIDDPADFLRIEIATALQRNIRVLPVLVGGAKMPSPQDLPGPVVRLAYLNAFEIYDRLFDESCRRLIDVLAPSVRTRAWMWTWNTVLRQYRKDVRVRLAAGACAALFLVALVIAQLPVQRAARLPEEQKVTPEASSAAAKPATHSLTADIAVPAPARRPVRITQLPAAPEAGRNAFTALMSSKGLGPRQPVVKWKVVFDPHVNGRWQLSSELIGVAGDGTLYFWGTNRDLSAIRDGKEQWLYSLVQENEERVGLSSDGRVWIVARENIDVNRVFCFNSRGEGGLVAGLEDAPRLLPRDAKELQKEWEETPDGRYFSYGRICDLGVITGADAHQQSKWSVQLEGSCSVAAKNDRGEVIVRTDGGALHCITHLGRTRWSYDPKCNTGPVYALGGDDVLYGCGTDLFALRSGKPRWKFSLGDGTSPSADAMLADKSGTVYISFDGPSAHWLAAVDESGQLRWKHPFGAALRPLILDRNNRLYVRSGATLACLSD